MSKTPSKLQQHLAGSLKSAQKKSAVKARAAAPVAAPAPSATEEEDADESGPLPPPVVKSAKKKKSIAPTPAPAQMDEEDDIALFRPSTAISAAAAAAESTAAAPAVANGRSSYIADVDEEDAEGDASITSSAFLRTLLETQTPDLLRALGDLRAKAKEIRKQTVRPLLREMRDGNLPTQDGMSFLELKSHLLLQYLQHLVYFVLVKLGGGPQQADRIAAVVKQLVYLRTVIEKIKPLDKKLRYQVEKMVKLANHMGRSAAETAEEAAEGEAAPMPSAGTGEDPLSFRPNPAALLATTEDAERANAEDGGSESATKLYRAPRITSTQLDDHERSQDRRNKALERAQSRAASSSYMQHMRDELSSRPEERRIDMDDDRPDAEQIERTNYEEHNLLRLTDTRKDKARRKEKERAKKNSLAGLDDFDDFRDFERANRDLRDQDMMSPDRMDELQREAMGRKRKGRDDDGDAFDDPLQSRHAKKRLGPNGKNPHGARFGGGKGGRGRGRGGRR